MIASIGESLIDNIGGREHVGGCPYNVAIGASRLGAAASFYGKVSKDEHGRAILERMIDSGVLFDPDLCNADEPTMCAQAVTDVDGTTRYEFKAEGTAAFELTQKELSDSLNVASDIDIVFFGSLALLVEPSSNAVVPAIHGIKTHPKYFFDPNIRPTMSNDHEAYRKMVLSLLGGCDVVKMSDDDVAFLMPGVETSVAERRLAGMCEWNLIVTHGSKGATWYTKFFRVDCPAYEAGTVVDTIGCGDTFSAAVLAYLQIHGLISDVADLDKGTIERILRYATKAAALNCLNEGCEPPFAEQM